MQGELVQIISLTSYGNEFLKTKQIPVNYFPDNSTFQFCKNVTFKEYKKRWLSSKFTESVSAENPIEWFKTLKKEGCKKIRLYYKPSDDIKSQPEYNFVGFVGGGGKWLIETIFRGYSHYWHNSWQVGDRNDRDRKIWLVNYSRTVEQSFISDQKSDIAFATNELKNLLLELIAFCEEHNISWKQTFEKALSALTSANPNAGYYHYDLIVLKNYSLAAQQLLFSVGHSWVFGGMGSWNDMGFRDKEVNDVYLRLSGQLYSLLLQGIIASVNSF